MNVMKKYFWKRLEKVLDKYFKRKTEKKISKFKSCGKNFHYQEPFYFTGYENIEIGDNVVIAAFTHIWGEGGIIIGNNVMIASHTAITSITHNPKSILFSDENIFKPVIIGNNVWIGTHTVIFPGIKIGNNCIIGAGAVVNKDVPDGSVFAGVPAKEIYRLDQFTSQNSWNN
jgi:acetyltransferase-like isoleucine patch superfamily enzyme